MADTVELVLGYRDIDGDRAARFAAVLGELGISCAISNGTLSVDVPTQQAARAMRTRGAGAKRKYIYPPAGSPLSVDTTCKEFLAWLEGHTAAEAMEALGIGSPATYFRRLRDIREIAEEDADTPLWMV